MTECIEWQGAKDPNGYGRLTVQQVQLYAHRWVWEQAFGAVPKGLCVCHACDNPSCVNLDHLWLGTHAENMADAKHKGRARGGGAKGEAQHLHKLTEAQVREILASDELQSVLAERYGVSQGTISNIRLRKTWRHLEMEPT